ncbi:MAG: hypothetical protein ACFFAE_00880 [Candidatus Hodarchaeota archaeon]
MSQRLEKKIFRFVGTPWLLGVFIAWLDSFHRSATICSFPTSPTCPSIIFITFS